MKLRPLHNYVLIQRDVKAVTSSTIVTLDDKPSTTATVLAVGPDVVSLKPGARIHVEVILNALKYDHDGMPDCELVREDLVGCAFPDE